MIASLRSEFRKLLTVRSTYFILAIMLAIEIFFAFWATGYDADAQTLANPGYLGEQVIQAISALGLFITLVGLLLVTHEYRYNTITYTLTAARSRTNVLLSKTIVVSVFAVVASVVFGLLSPLLTALGVHMAGHALVPQTYEVWDILWRTLFFGWGFAMFGLILAVIIRNQIGAIAAILLIPTTIESLIGLLLKNNVVYLPFSSLSAVVMQVTTSPNVISHVKAALVAAIYIVGGWAIAWILFLKRDAN